MSASTRPEIVESLRRDILSHRFEPGSRLPILELQDRFGVGLTSLHKAFAQLTADGLIVSEGERGVRAAPVSRADLIDLTKARVGVEVLAIRDAVSNSDAESDDKISVAFFILSRTPVFENTNERVFTEAYLARHRAFHDVLSVACTSSRLRQFRSTLFAHAERYQQLSIHYRDRDGQDEHAEIVQAVMDRDADRAANLLTAHITSPAELLLEQCFPESPDVPPRTDIVSFFCNQAHRLDT